MAKALVVCPATESTELIEFVDTPFGALIHACSRFRPATALTCGRPCMSAARYDLAEIRIEFDLDDTELDVCRAIPTVDPADQR